MFPNSSYAYPPSAPPEYEMNWEQPSPPSPPPSYSSHFPPPKPAGNATFGRDINLKDDCVICLNQLSARAEDDPSTKLEVAQLKCKHVFHNFCIQNNMKNGQPGSKDNCPLCRAKIDKVALAVISLGNAPAPVKPAPAQKPPAQPTFGRDINLKDDCVICLNQLSARAEADPSTKLEVAQLKCKHVFHNFCIQNNMKNGQPGSKDNCPLCRAKIDKVALAVISLGNAPAPVKPVQPVPVKPIQAQPKPAADEGVNLAEIAGNALWGIGKGLWWGLKAGGKAVAFVGSTAIDALTPAPKTVKSVEEHSVKVVRTVQTAHKDMLRLLGTQKERIEVLVAQVLSLAARDPEGADQLLTEIDREMYQCKQAVVLANDVFERNLSKKLS